MNKNIQIEIPQPVRFIIERLNKHGYEAYIVGGCVRDALLGREAHDWDITTSARPEAVKAMFKRTIDTGILHGTVTVMEDHVGYEVTTYRTGVRFEEREEKQMTQFADSLREDLCHRDFTINAMAYNPVEGLVDLFDGVGDLEKKRIVCVENAADRFHEDPLRILRAVRFAAQLGFSVDDSIKKELPMMSRRLANVSPERIHDELVKLFLSERPEYFKMLYDTGITAVILPEFDRAFPVEQNCKYHCYNVGEHTLHVADCARDLSKDFDSERKLSFRMAAILHDLGKYQTKTTDEFGIDHFRGHQIVSMEMAEEILTRLRFDNKTITRTCKMIRFHDYYMDLNEISVRQGISLIGQDYIEDVVLFQRADAAGKSEETKNNMWKQLDDTDEIIRLVTDRGDCVTLKMLAVSGKDLIAAGIKPGPLLGDTLQKLLAHVLEHPEDNEKDKLLKLL